jgi:hypothetical protein
MSLNGMGAVAAPGLLSGNGFWKGRESSSGLWECGNRAAISKGVGKRGKPAFGFPRFPSPVISTALLLHFNAAFSRP